MKNYQRYLENAIIYQINLRTFTNGGTLKAAEKLLPHLKRLGVDVVYLCPCFVEDADENRSGWSQRQRESGYNNPKNPYRIADFYNVDEEYGTNQDLADYVGKAHALGLRVILDAVYFHCGPNAVFLKENPDFVVCKEDGSPDTGEWNFPRLNFDNPKLREYLIRNMEAYVRDFKVDGFRCDSSDLVPLDFWLQARERVERLNPEFMTLHEGHNLEHLQAFDVGYSWFYSNGIEQLLSGEKPEEAIAAIVAEFEEREKKGVREFCSFVEQHDVVNNAYDNRLEKRIGEQGMEACLAGLFTLPYVPLLYAGEEVADTNKHSIFCNRFHGANNTIDWQNALTETGARRLAFVKRLAELRHTIPALSLSARTTFIKGEGINLLSFIREKGGEKYLIAINFSTNEQELTTNFADKKAEALLVGKAKIQCEKGALSIRLSAWGYAIVKL